MGKPETGRGTIGEVRDGSRDPWGGSELDGEIRDGSGDTQGGPGQVKGPSERSGTGRGTLEEVRKGSVSLE